VNNRERPSAPRGTDLRPTDTQAEVAKAAKKKKKIQYTCIQFENLYSRKICRRSTLSRSSTMR
jgi:hypothetical protein